MTSIIHTIQQWLARLRQAPKPAGSLDAQVVKGLMGAITHTHDHELGCEEVFEWLDLYVEGKIGAQDSAELRQLIEHHLSLCDECRAELQFLLKMVSHTTPEILP